MSGSHLILLGGSPKKAAVDPYFYSVTSLLHGDGTNGAQNNTFLDSSTNNFTITRNGNTTQGSFSPFSQTGWSNYFSTNSLSATDSSNLLDLGGAAASVEMFVYPTAGGTQVIFSKHGGSSSWSTSNGFEYQVQYVSNIFNFIYNSGGSPVTVTDSISRPANQWYHVAVATNTSNNISFYINGTRVATSTSSITKPSSRAAILLGNDLNNNYTVAYISNLRFITGSNAINPTSTSITVPTTALTAVTGTQFLTCQSNRFVDNSSNAFALSVSGSPSVQPFSPFNPITPYSTSAVGGSGYFDGSGDYLSIANNSAFNLGTNNFCIEGWFYPTTSNATQLVFNKWGTVSDTQSMFQIGRISSTFYAQLKTTGGFVTLSTATWIPNAWNHFAVVRNGSTISAYLNGSRFGTDTSNPTLNSGTETMTIGSKQAQDYFTGYITDCRIVNGSAIYDPTQTSITVPTAPLTAVTNTAFLSANINAGIFDNAADADYETVGNAQISTSVKKYGTGSMAFDGTGDYLTIPYNQFMNFGTGDFTIEGWFYLNSFANQYYVLGGTWTTGTSDEWLIQIENNGSLRFLTTANTSFFATGLIKTGTWYHFAASRNAGVIKAYINGTAFATIANTNSIGSTSKVLNIGQQPGGTWPWNGYVDDWRISKGVGRYPYNFTPPTAEFPNIGGTVTLTADPYFDYTTLLLPGNGTNGAQNNTFLDSSTNNFTITRNGNTTQGTFSPFSQTGWGNYFDGTGDYLSLPSNTAFTMGTGDFTLEAWVYINAAKDYNFVFDSRASDSDAAGFGFFVDSSSRLCFYTNYNFRIQAGSVPINTWNHVALVRNGSTFTAYVNGVSVGTYTATPNLTNSTGRIGIDWASLYSMNGYISNFRLVKGTAVYTSSFTPPTAPLTAITNTSLLTCQSNRFIDSSANNFAITRNGDVSVQAFSPFNPTAAWSAATNGGSGYFDGSGDYLTLPADAAFTFGTGDFTIDGWIYISALDAVNAKGVFQQGTSSFPASTTNTVALGVNPAATYSIYAKNTFTNSTATATLNSWTHFALVRSGTTTTLYANGTAVITVTSDSTNYTGTFFGIGSIFGTSGTNWNGYISGLRVVKGTAVYTTTFTPPTAPTTAISGTSLLTNFTNAGIYDATSKNDLETVGNAQISTTQSKFGGSSIYFDGNGDYLKAISTDLLNFGTGDFTIEFWSYFNSTADSGGLGMGVITNPTGTYSTIYSSTNGGTTLTFYNGSGIVSGTIALSTWQHIAVSRYNGTVRFFVNGIQTASATHTSAVTFSAAFIGSQTGSGGYFNGYLDDLRITKGIARYTSNFTPPTTAFLTL